MKMSKDLSLAMIRMEIDNAPASSESIGQMLKTVEQAVKEDRISYDEFVTSLAEYFEELVPADIDNSSEEERANIVKVICNKIIDKYGSEEK